MQILGCLSLRILDPWGHMRWVILRLLLRVKLKRISLGSKLVVIAVVETFVGFVHGRVPLEGGNRF